MYAAYQLYRLFQDYNRYYSRQLPHIISIIPNVLGLSIRSTGYFSTGNKYCIFTYSRVAGEPRNQCYANRVFVAITLSFRARAFNLGKESYDQALGRVLPQEAPPPCSIASAHSGYLVNLLTSQTAFQQFFVNNTAICCKIDRTLCKSNYALNKRS